jgi:hypothetical protein
MMPMFKSRVKYTHDDSMERRAIEHGHDDGVAGT